MPSMPVILVFDNEQVEKKPLRKFKEYVGEKIVLENKLYSHIIDNLYVLTHPLLDGSKENEIENLFDKSTLETVIDGRTFTTKAQYDSKQFYGKKIFADYVGKNYEKIDFSKFKPILNDIEAIIVDYKDKSKKNEDKNFVCDIQSVKKPI